MVQIAVSGESGPQLTPGIEHHLVDRVAVRAEPGDQRVQRDTVEDDRDEDLTLRLSGMMSITTITNSRLGTFIAGAAQLKITMPGRTGIVFYPFSKQR